MDGKKDDILIRIQELSGFYISSIYAIEDVVHYGHNSYSSYTLKLLESDIREASPYVGLAVAQKLYVPIEPFDDETKIEGDRESTSDFFVLIENKENKDFKKLAEFYKYLMKSKHMFGKNINKRK